MNKQMKQDWG